MIVASNILCFDFAFNPVKHGFWVLMHAVLGRAWLGYCSVAETLTAQCLCWPLSGCRKHTYKGMEPFNIYIPGPLTVLKLDLLIRAWLILKSHWNLFLASCDGSPLLTHASSRSCGLCRCVLFLCVRLSQFTVLLKGVWTFSSPGFNGF